MKVNLLGYTMTHDDDPVAVKKPDVQNLISYCARVSNPSNQNNSETSSCLLYTSPSPRARG